MVAGGYITPSQASAAASEPPTLPMKPGGCPDPAANRQPPAPYPAFANQSRMFRVSRSKPGETMWLTAKAGSSAQPQ
jgi:hypothetical protein